jgi:hypothetical protein
MRTVFAIIVVILAVLAGGCTVQSPATATPASPATPTAAVTTTAIPDVIGIWTGMTYGHSQDEGFRQHDKSRYNISKQTGYAFLGSKEYIREDGKTYYENFSGVVSDSGEIYMADNPKGYSSGKLTGPDTMELYYVEDGPGAKAYLSRFTRQKS